MNMEKLHTAYRADKRCVACFCIRSNLFYILKKVLFFYAK